MDKETAIIIAACITATATTISAFIVKNDYLNIFKRRKLNLTGTWLGISSYIPIDSYRKGSECIYKFSAEIKQLGSRVTLEESITEFYTLELQRIDGQSIRKIEGKGKLFSDCDLMIQFKEADSLTCGTMYLTSCAWGKELKGIIAVRNPHLGTSVAVKVLMRKSGGAEINEKDIDIERIRTIAKTLKSS